MAALPFESLLNLTSHALPLLLDAAVRSVLVLAIAGLVVLWLRRASAAARHWVWMTALASLMVLPVLSLALPVVRHILLT